MQDLTAARAETVTGRPSPEKVFLFESALWGSPRNSDAIFFEMRPAYCAGGFPLPGYRGNHALIVDAGRTLPPCGGYVEETGRNGCADGCSSWPLIPPPRKGGPWVSHLHVTAGTVQARHHHPSDRIGMVVRGRGLAHHEAGPPMILYPGRAWKLFAGERHHFETRDESLDVLVFHPDSEWGPTDEAHRLLDATII